MSQLERPTRGEAAALVREHERALRAFVGARVTDPAEADDVCQEVFAAALDKGLPAEGAGPWLFAIARNKALRWARDRKAVAEPVERSGRDESPSGRLQAVEERDRVRTAVRALDEELREVILLRYEGGLDYRQIADRLEVPVSTIQGRLKRARLALREALGDDA